MVGTKFLVQWEEHPTHLATRLGYLLEHQSLVDVTLMCNTHTLKVHRSVLAACSPYFESVLQRQLGNQPLIVLKDMKFSVLKSLVEFMYCGETSVTEENLNPLMEAAKFFEVKGLSSMTKEAIGDRGSIPLTNQSPISSTSINGITTIPTSGGRGGRRPGAGRGRRSSTMTGGVTTLTAGNNQGQPTNQPTEPAQILLSLSGNTTQPSSGIQTAGRNVRIGGATNSSRLGKVFSPTTSQQQDSGLVLGGNSPVIEGVLNNNNKQSPSYLRNGSVVSPGDNAGMRPPIRGGYEPRRRGRRRNPANIAAFNRTNMAFRDSEASRIAVENLQKEMENQSGGVIDPKDNKLGSSLWNSNTTVDKSPLLASLLSKSEGYAGVKNTSNYSSMKVKAEGEDGSCVDTSSSTTDDGGQTFVYQVDDDAIQSGDLKYLEALKEAGLPTDVPILIDNGDGNYVTLTEDVLMNVMESKDEYHFHVTAGTLEGGQVGEGVVLQDGSIVMERKAQNVISEKEMGDGVRQFVVKEMQATKSDEDDSAVAVSKSNSEETGSDKNSDNMSVQEIINEAVLETLKPDNKEAEIDPDAVVLFEVTENSKVEKIVLSSKEVNALKALNEQILQQKRQLQDKNVTGDKKTGTQVSNVGVIGGNTKIAEIKLSMKSKSTKSLLSQVLECAQGLEEKLKKQNDKQKGVNERKDGSSSGVVKGQSQLVELEFIDGNGERIEGYQIEGTVITNDNKVDEVFEKEINNTRTHDREDDDDDVNVMDMLMLEERNVDEASHDANIVLEDQTTAADIDGNEIITCSEQEGGRVDVAGDTCITGDGDKGSGEEQSDEVISMADNKNCDENLQVGEVTMAANQQISMMLVGRKTSSGLLITDDDFSGCQLIEKQVIVGEENLISMTSHSTGTTVDSVLEEVAPASLENMKVQNLLNKDSNGNYHQEQNLQKVVTEVEGEEAEVLVQANLNEGNVNIEDSSSVLVPELVLGEDEVDEESSCKSMSVEQALEAMMGGAGGSRRRDHIEGNLCSIKQTTQVGQRELIKEGGLENSNQESPVSESESRGMCSSSVTTAEVKVMSLNEFQEISAMNKAEAGGCVTVMQNSPTAVMDNVDEMIIDNLVEGAATEEKRMVERADVITDMLINESVPAVIEECLQSSNNNTHNNSNNTTSTSPTKDVPFAVGLLPLKTALEKIQTIPEYQPRKTRSGSISKEDSNCSSNSCSSNSNISISSSSSTSNNFNNSLPPNTCSVKRKCSTLTSGEFEGGQGSFSLCGESPDGNENINVKRLKLANALPLPNTNSATGDMTLLGGGDSFCAVVYDSNTETYEQEETVKVVSNNETVVHHLEASSIVDQIVESVTQEDYSDVMASVVSDNTGKEEVGGETATATT